MFSSFMHCYSVGFPKLDLNHSEHHEDNDNGSHPSTPQQRLLPD